MATTQHILVAETARKAQGDNDTSRPPGLKAKLATGLAILGCAAALAFGGMQLGAGARSQPHVVQPASGVLDREQAGRARVATGQSLSFVDWEQEERAQVAPPSPAAPLDWEQAERAQVAP